MAQLIVRDVDDLIAEALRRRAAENGRSAEAEHRQILREVLGQGAAATADFAAAAARLRSRLVHGGDSAATVREARDGR
jgi:plasmid stability protein